MDRVMMVAEIGINHNGDIDLAKRLIDVAVLADCDFVKFQKRTINLVYDEEDLGRYRESPWGTTNREQKEGLEFGKEEYNAINEYCKERNIEWYASPWDIKSVHFLQQYDFPFIKVASACLTDSALLSEIRKLDKPIVLSTGMSTKQELDWALEIVGDKTEYILACTSTYPAFDAEMNLRFMQTLKDQYPQYKIGFSNHSPGIQYSVVSAALGAEMIEFHITMNRAMYGSDQASSIETGGVMALSKHVRNLELAMGTGEWTVFESEEVVKKSLRRFV
jgi:N-acetylneuraminate synthase